MLDNDKNIIKNNPTLTEKKRENQLIQIEKTKEYFEMLFEEKKHNELVKEGFKKLCNIVYDESGKDMSMIKHGGAAGAAIARDEPGQAPRRHRRACGSGNRRFAAEDRKSPTRDLASRRPAQPKSVAGLRSRRRSPGRRVS